MTALPKEVIDYCFKGGHLECKHLHSGSCEFEAISRFVKVFIQSSKFYGPIHLIPIICFKLKKLYKEPKTVIKSFLKNLCRSCLFLATYMSLLKYGLCFWKNYFLDNRPRNVALSAAWTFPGMYWEADGRRTEMSLYFLSPAFENIYNCLVKRGYFTPIENGEIFLFMVTMCIMMYCYQFHPDTIKPLYRSILEKIFGEN